MSRSSSNNPESSSSVTGIEITETSHVVINNHTTNIDKVMGSNSDDRLSSFESSSVVMGPCAKRLKQEEHVAATTTNGKKRNKDEKSSDSKQSKAKKLKMSHGSAPPGSSSAIVAEAKVVHVVSADDSTTANYTNETSFGTPNQEGSACGEHAAVRFREYHAETWSLKFEEMCNFRRKYGHCHVPHHYKESPSLAQWVKRQRYQYKLKLENKHTTLTDERTKLLSNIGFVWSSHDVVWEERLNDLMLFKRLNGHCIVPSGYEANPQLAVWIKRQRRQYKKYIEALQSNENVEKGAIKTSSTHGSAMTLERITRLNEVGFVWDCSNLKIGTSQTSSSIAATTTNDIKNIVAKRVSASEAEIGLSETLPTTLLKSGSANAREKCVDMIPAPQYILMKMSSQNGNECTVATKPPANDSLSCQECICDLPKQPSNFVMASHSRRDHETIIEEDQGALCRNEVPLIRQQQCKIDSVRKLQAFFTPKHSSEEEEAEEKQHHNEKLSTRAPRQALQRCDFFSFCRTIVYKPSNVNK